MPSLSPPSIRKFQEWSSAAKVSMDSLPSLSYLCFPTLSSFRIHTLETERRGTIFTMQTGTRQDDS